MNERRETIQSLKIRLDHAKRFPDMIIVEFWDRSLDGREYRRWFRECLNKKINREFDHSGKRYSGDYQIDQIVDARIIRDALFKRQFRSGTNILRTPELAKRYPEINARIDL